MTSYVYSLATLFLPLRREGAGPCLFCGSLIFPPDEEKMLAKDSKKAHKIKEKLIKQYNLVSGVDVCVCVCQAFMLAIVCMRRPPHFSQ